MEGGKFIYISCFDLAGAFDTVPHSCLIQTTEKAHIELYIARYMAIWLADGALGLGARFYHSATDGRNSAVILLLLLFC